MEIHHIIPESEGGPDTIDNAIAVCFDCHAEIQHYNPEHPRGRRFTYNELRGHKNQWLGFCATNPVALAGAVPPAEGGSLERLLCELIYNGYLAKIKHPAGVYEVAQFRRAVADGTLNWLKDEQVNAVNKTYALINEINNRAQGLTSVGHPGARASLSSAIEALLPKVDEAIQEAVKTLQKN
jgi:hypothetical protein